MSSQNILQQIKKLPLPFTSESRSAFAPYAIALTKKSNKQKPLRSPLIPSTYRTQKRYKPMIYLPITQV
ncbi:MAG: hypothetical protein EAZ09_08580 [Oscillatoriales cyanobacterium]|nr:MAG: hypothetical protein EAZ18_07885 [Oscillatoriales cyanobacterium]TAH23073.1 MAG: hypothetical protein EAZ09_08580 [Oscillatoriales cyanobacterium]